MGKLPQYVQRKGDKYRAWAMVCGKRVWSGCFDDPHSAYQEALVMRGDAKHARQLVTLGEAMDKVLEETAAKRAEGTVTFYRKHFDGLTGGNANVQSTRSDMRKRRAKRKHFFSRSMPLHRVTVDHIEGYVQERLHEGVRASTVNHELRSLGRVFSIAMKRGYIGHNPVRQVDRPTHRQREMDYFEAREVFELVEKIAKADLTTARRDADVILLAFYTGLRRSEIARLRISDIDLKTGNLWIRGKTDNEKVAMAEDLAPILTRLIGLRTEGSLVSESPGQIGAIFGRWSRRLREPRLHPHALRHSFITALVRAGHPLHVVQKLARHKTVTMTMRYFHSDGQEIRAAINTLGRGSRGSNRTGLHG